MRKTIIDISYSQGQINFDLVKTNPQKIDGAYIKLNEGIGEKYIDTRVRQNIEGCQRIGLPFGFYHFATLNVPQDVKGDALKECDFFLSVMNKLSVSPSIIPAIDIETNTGHLTPDQVVLWMNTFFSELRNNGVPDFRLYDSPNGLGGLNTILPKGHPFGNIKLWTAQYPPAWTEASQPILPHGWPTYDMWQYTRAARVQGISANTVDMSITRE